MQLNYRENFFRYDNFYSNFSPKNYHIYIFVVNIYVILAANIQVL